MRLLYVSLYLEHKNLTTLLKAIPLLHSQDPRRFRLTTTLDPNSEDAGWTMTGPTDRALAQQSDIRDSLEIVGVLGQAETQRLYSQAEVFVFPSLTESFGFPMVEAMAHGLPIIAAETPVNREICEDAAVYFSPLDCQDLAALVRRVAAGFRWPAHVGRVFDGIRHLLAESQAGAPELSRHT